MNQQQTTKRLPRPDLRISPSQWSTAQKGGVSSRVAIVTTVTAILGGLSLVFLYPYLNIERFRNVQNINRAGINAEDTQPVGLPVWRDPFDRKKSS